MFAEKRLLRLPRNSTFCRIRPALGPRTVDEWRTEPTANAYPRGSDGYCHGQLEPRWQVSLTGFITVLCDNDALYVWMFGMAIMTG